MSTEPAVRPRFVSLRRWASGCGFGYSWARSVAHRALDPLPTRRLGRRLWIDVAAAEEWMLRQSRVGPNLSAIVDSIFTELRGGEERPSPRAPRSEGNSRR